MLKRTVSHNYNNTTLNAVDGFVSSLKNAAGSAASLDSAVANEFTNGALSQNSAIIPESLKPVLDEAGDKAPLIVRALFDSVGAYEKAHGINVPADIVNQAIHAAYGKTIEAKKKYSLDSASNDHADNLGLAPSKAVVAIFSAMSEAIPFAHYLPADIGSNEARLAIMNHQAGSLAGGYTQGAIMDGAESGRSYLSSSRVHTCAVNATTGAITGKLTNVQTTSETCNQSLTGIKLLRGRSMLYINGMIAAKEVDSTGSGASVVTGKITLLGVEYVVSGTINTDTGEIALGTAPALPATATALVEGFVDFERQTDLIPSIITAVNVFSLYAKPWRAVTSATIDSRTQMSNELGLDPASEGVIAINTQFANERHYDVLRKAMRVSMNNVADMDFNWVARSQQLNLAQVWQDFSAVVGQLSQKMAIDTMNHGITHLYVGPKVASQLMGMDAASFMGSGLSDRPNIYRIGTLFGRYEVYFAPNLLAETATSAQVLCIGRATDVTRNPFILGDAVSPTVMPLAVNADMRTGTTFYARNFTALNPHQPSSMGAAMITIRNMGA